MKTKLTISAGVWFTSDSAVRPACAARAGRTGGTPAPVGSRLTRSGRAGAGMLTAVGGTWGVRARPSGTAGRGARNRVPPPARHRHTDPLPRTAAPGPPGDRQGFWRTCMDAVGLVGAAPAAIADYQGVPVLGE